MKKQQLKEREGMSSILEFVIDILDFILELDIINGIRKWMKKRKERKK